MQVSEQALADVAREVLETMAFAFVMPETIDVGDSLDHVVRASVRFRGPFAGIVHLTVPAAIVPNLVANMLGECDGGDFNEEQQHDALGELANVMCGNLVQQVAGPEPVFELDAPTIEAGSAAAPLAPLEDVHAARLPLDEGWAELAVKIDG